MTKMNANVCIIAAVALNGAIGRNNSLLWHIAADMKFFRETTVGGCIIMGRRTFDSIGKALPGRLNIVVSRSKTDFPENVVPAGSLEQALEIASEHPDRDIFVIGGGQIYAQAMDIANKMLITRVFLSPQDADTFFPAIEADKWNITIQSEMATSQEGISYRFESWEKIL